MSTFSQFLKINGAFFHQHVGLFPILLIRETCCEQFFCSTTSVNTRCAACWLLVRAFSWLADFFGAKKRRRRGGSGKYGCAVAFARHHPERCWPFYLSSSLSHWHIYIRWHILETRYCCENMIYCFKHHLSVDLFAKGGKFKNCYWSWLPKCKIETKCHQGLWEKSSRIASGMPKESLRGVALSCFHFRPSSSSQSWE